MVVFFLLSVEVVCSCFSGGLLLHLGSLSREHHMAWIALWGASWDLDVNPTPSVSCCRFRRAICMQMCPLAGWIPLIDIFQGTRWCCFPDMPGMDNSLTWNPGLRGDHSLLFSLPQISGLDCCRMSTFSLCCADGWSFGA